MARPTSAPTLAVEVQDGQVKLRITATDAESTLAWARRVDPDGVTRHVRSLQAVPLLGREAVGFDYEPPLDAPITYLAYVTDADPANQSPPATHDVAAVPYVLTRLCSTATPYWKATARIQSMSGLKRDVAYGAHYVLGRKAPITIADVRQLATFTLTIATTSSGQAASLRSLLDDNPHLLLQAHPDEGGNTYVLCSSYTEDRAAPTVAAHPDRVWTLDCLQVDPPAAPLADTGQGTYAQLAATFTSYTALSGFFTNYGELAAWNGPAALTGRR